MAATGDSELIQHPDGRVELRDYGSIQSSPLYNHDLAPVPVAQRDWSTYNYAAPIYLRMIDAFRAGKLDEAEADYKKAQEFRPDDFLSSTFLSEIYVMQGRPQDALAEIESV